MSLVSLLFTGVLGLLVLFLLFVFFVFQRRAAYFKKHGIPNLGTQLGRTWRLMKGEITVIDLDRELYKEAKATKSKIVGMSDMFGMTYLYITDLDLIKCIMVKDFDHFVNLRTSDTKVSSKYFSRMLFTMKDDQWKGVRSKLSPAFTTGKLRRIFELFHTSNLRMEKYIKEQINYPKQNSMDMDITKILFKYSMDVIASSAFGIDSQCWNYAPGQLSTFEKYGKQIEFKFDAKTISKFILMLTLPKIADYFEVEAIDDEGQTYFANVIKSVIKNRKETGERREDFLQLLMDIQAGVLKADEETSEVMHGGETTTETFKGQQQSRIKFTDEDVIANAVMFFFVGFETTQAVLVFALYSLAVHQEVQQKLYQNVVQTMAKHENKLTYEAISEMTYLDWVINETIRIFPPNTRLERTCTKDYPVPGMNFVIKKGTLIGISHHGIHLDEEYWPEPMKYMPERFSPENKAGRHPHASMPFGHGPRSCIAMRFALIKVKAMIAHFVRNFELEPCSRTQIPPEFSSSVSAKPKDGMWLNVKVREN